MTDPLPGPPEPRFRLDGISTQWSRLADASHFVMRYGPAIRRYLDALLHDPQEGEEVAQELMLWVVQNGFRGADPNQGKFRHYLKEIVRNAAWKHRERKRRLPVGGLDLDRQPDSGEDREAAETWTAEWRECVLDRAWQAIESHERDAPKSLFHTVLRAAVDFPDEGSDALARRLSAQLGRPLRTEAFRKQLSRARRFFAESIVRELAETIETATPESIEQEIVDLGLMPYLRDFLPPDWQSRGELREGE